MLNLKTREIPAREQTTANVCDDALELLRQLSAQVAHGVLARDFPRRLSRIYSLVAALPLSTDEFGSAVNRLRNVATYLRANEHGAASYELRLLSSAVNNYR